MVGILTPLFLFSNFTTFECLNLIPGYLNFESRDSSSRQVDLTAKTQVSSPGPLTLGLEIPPWKSVNHDLQRLLLQYFHPRYLRLFDIWLKSTTMSFRVGDVPPLLNDPITNDLRPSISPCSSGILRLSGKKEKVGTFRRYLGRNRSDFCSVNCFDFTPTVSGSLS